jgi:broad specificity phosphatase PhoE
MIKNLYIFRHGETDYNIARRMQSVLDIPLNQNGIHQAEELAKKLAGVNLGCIYTSKLGRAIETAKIVAKPNNTPVIVDNRLHEWDLGVFKGKILNVIKAPKYTPIDLTTDTVSIPRLLLIDNDYVPENGESFNTCINRVSEALDYIEYRF